MYLNNNNKGICFCFFKKGEEKRIEEKKRNKGKRKDRQRRRGRERERKKEGKGKEGRTDIASELDRPGFKS